MKWASYRLLARPAAPWWALVYYKVDAIGIAKRLGYNVKPLTLQGASTRREVALASHRWQGRPACERLTIPPAYDRRAVRTIFDAIPVRADAGPRNILTVECFSDLRCDGYGRSPGRSIAHWQGLVTIVRTSVFYASRSRP
jgi:hypothetical protein